MAKKQKRVFILGGGAALGAHHVGAMRLLDEQGIKPDAIVASSIGVINACAYASGGVPQLEEADRADVMRTERRPTTENEDPLLLLRHRQRSTTRTSSCGGAALP